jgi:hypothetical protein
MTYYNKELSMATDEFLSAFCAGGGPIEECDFCGKTYYSTTNLDEEDLASLEEQRVKHPDKFFPEEYDAIEYYEINGMKWVYECPCNGLDRYETFIWNESYRILDYLGRRSNREFNEATYQKKIVDEAIVHHETAKKVVGELEKANGRLVKAKDYIR